MGDGVLRRVDEQRMAAQKLHVLHLAICADQHVEFDGPLDTGWLGKRRVYSVGVEKQVGGLDLRAHAHDREVERGPDQHPRKRTWRVLKAGRGAG